MGRFHERAHEHIHVSFCSFHQRLAGLGRLGFDDDAELAQKFAQNDESGQADRASRRAPVDHHPVGKELAKYSVFDQALKREAQGTISALIPYAVTFQRFALVRSLGSNSESPVSVSFGLSSRIRVTTRA